MFMFNIKVQIQTSRGNETTKGTGIGQFRIDKTAEIKI